jgi:signal transduction histidine kinase
LLEVDADVAVVDRIVSNLVRNALRHGRPPVVVSASADTGDGPVRIRVSDAGGGVPADVRDSLFDQFTRSAQATGTGSGLGLAIARSYAQAHGGDVVLVENGIGATFELRLPA